jgi:hypothetical protein
MNFELNPPFVQQNLVPSPTETMNLFGFFSATFLSSTFFASIPSEAMNWLLRAMFARRAVSKEDRAGEVVFAEASEELLLLTTMDDLLFVPIPGDAFGAVLGDLRE